jgi:hypothetical protein
MTPSTRAQIDNVIETLCDNPEELKAGLDRLERESRFVDSLIDARRRAGLSHAELAAASGLSPAKIGEMESGNDAALNLADVQAYLKGVGKTLRVSALPRPSRPRTRRPRPVPVLA